MALTNKEVYELVNERVGEFWFELDRYQLEHKEHVKTIGIEKEVILTLGRNFYILFKMIIDFGDKLHVENWTEKTYNKELWTLENNYVIHRDHKRVFKLKHVGRSNEVLYEIVKDRLAEFWYKLSGHKARLGIEYEAVHDEQRETIGKLENSFDVAFKMLIDFGFNIGDWNTGTYDKVKRPDRLPALNYYPSKTLSGEVKNPMFKWSEDGYKDLTGPEDSDLRD